MRLSSLLFLIFVGITCVLAAIVPPTLIHGAIQNEPVKDPTSRLEIDQTIASIDLNGASLPLSIEIVDSLQAPEISIPASDYTFDAETGALTLNEGCSGHISIRMPQSALLSVVGVTPDASIYLAGIDTPILALDAMPGILNIDRSVINTLVIGGEIAADSDKSCHITLTDNSDIDAIVTASDEQPSMLVNASRVGTSVTL